MKNINHKPLCTFSPLFPFSLSLSFFFSLVLSFLFLLPTLYVRVEPQTLTLTKVYYQPIHTTMTTAYYNHLQRYSQVHPQPSYSTFQSYRITYLRNVVPHKIENSVLLFDVESLLTLHAPPMSPTKQTSLEILSKSMGNQGQLRHFQRGFGISLHSSQPIHQLYAFITLQNFDRDCLGCITLDLNVRPSISFNLKEQLAKLGFTIKPPSQSTLYQPRMTGNSKWPSGANPSYDYFRCGDLLYNIWFLQRGNGVLRPTPHIRNNSCYYAVVDLIVIFSSMETSTNCYKRAHHCFDSILKQTHTDPKCAKMFEQLQAERKLLFDPLVIERTYIAPGSFIQNILPLMDSGFAKEIQSVIAAKKASIPPTATPRRINTQTMPPMYIVSEDVTPTAVTSHGKIHISSFLRVTELCTVNATNVVQTETAHIDAESSGNLSIVSMSDRCLIACYIGSIDPVPEPNQVETVVSHNLGNDATSLY
jgi:hypothetical protein